MTVVKVDSGPSQIVIDVILDGRSELGRLGSPGIGLHPTYPSLVDEDGASYRATGFQGHVEGNPRRLSLTFEPVSEAAATLRLTVGMANFVNPESETAIGERPPDPSATLVGPWTVVITDFR